MESNSKLQIYQGVIQYLLETTNYTLKNIADLCNTSIKTIRSIYFESVIPSNFSSEVQLIKLYQMILEFNIDKNSLRYFR